jgi:hypothetical protein
MKEGGGHVPTGAKSWGDPLLGAGEARRVQQCLVAAPDGLADTTCENGGGAGVRLGMGGR